MVPIHKEFIKKSEDGSQKSRQEAGQVVKHLICHTGQHYDEKMSKVFFTDLELPQPDFPHRGKYLGVGSGSHAEQTARVMIEFEKVLTQEKPNLVMVYGDVNSTVACSLVAAKMGVKDCSC